MPRLATSNRRETRWTVRVIPFFIVATLGFAIYVIVPHLCINYLLRQKNQTAIAVILIVLFFLFLFLTLAAYVRTFLTVQLDPGFVPLTAEREEAEKVLRENRKRGGDIEELPWQPPDQNPDSPGLEAFYSKNVFVCEVDGRPKWCSQCRAWKPDRAHHSGEMERCIRKMDHLCPWVGGVVSETSFNFFFQFTFYCACLCIVVLATTGYSYQLQQRDGRPLDGRIIAGIALGSLFGLFTITMTVGSLRYILVNITNIDMLKKDHICHLAVCVPPNTLPTNTYQVITYPLPRISLDPNGISNSLPQNGPVNTNTNTDHIHTTIVESTVNGVSHIEAYSQSAPTPMNMVSARDQQAKKTFAILATEPGENPWDLGYWRNWKSVMGNSVFEWFLPIRHSPCCNHDSMESDYEYGPLVETLKRRYGLINEERPVKDGIEMRNAGPSRVGDQS